MTHGATSPIEQAPAASPSCTRWPTSRSRRSSASIITILVFLPLVTLEDVEGKMFRPVVVSLCFMLAGALVLRAGARARRWPALPPRASQDAQRAVAHPQAARAVYAPALGFVCAVRGRPSASPFALTFAPALHGHRWAPNSSRASSRVPSRSTRSARRARAEAGDRALEGGRADAEGGARGRDGREPHRPTRRRRRLRGARVERRLRHPQAAGQVAPGDDAREARAGALATSSRRASRRRSTRSASPSRCASTISSPA